MSMANGIEIFCYYMTKTDYSVSKSIMLTYYAFAIYAQINNAPLFLNKIESWKRGPVITDAYYQFGARLKSLKQQLQEKKITLNHNGFSEIYNDIRTVKNILLINDKPDNILFYNAVFKEVVSHYKKDNWNEINHSPGSDWDKVYINTQNNTMTIDIIKNDQIASKFINNVKDNITIQINSREQRKKMASENFGIIKIPPVTSVWD